MAGNFHIGQVAARTGRSKQVVLNKLLGPLRAKIIDRVRTNAQRFIAEGDHVVAVLTGHVLKDPDIILKSHAGAITEEVPQ